MQEIVIKIPNSLYANLKKIKGDSIAGKRIVDCVINGTVLPKGHGRLIDADILRSMFSINQANFNTVVGIQKWIDDAPTIIEGSEE